MKYIKNLWKVLMISVYLFIVGLVLPAKADVLDFMTIDAQGGGTPFVTQINGSRIVTDKRNVRNALFGNQSGLASIVAIFIRIIVALSVTMLIYTGIKYILAVGDSKQEWEVRQKIINILLWVVIAMASAFLIYLTGSITEGITKAIGL